MQISSYIEALPTKKDENYLYTDANRALAPVHTIVSSSIDAHGMGGTIYGTVRNINDVKPVKCSIAQELANLIHCAIEDVLRIEFNHENPNPVSVELRSNGGETVLAQCRLDVVATRGATGKLVVYPDYFDSSANVLINVVVKEDAELDIVICQKQCHLTPIFVTTLADVEKGGKISISTVDINQIFVRNNVEVNLNGEHAEARLYGIYKSKLGHVDNTTLVNHNAPNCTSEELYKGVLDGRADGAFAGRILVAPDAQKTSAQQTCRVMLLSENARSYAKPQLEIYADDVKCSHGATSGQIDPQQLFYMQQRGIDQKTAKQLLTDAFVLEVVNKIPVESVRKELLGEE